MNIKLLNNLKNGFTLIELLIIIAIISVLSVVIVSIINPSETGRKSRDAKRISDLTTIKRAIDMALADKQKLTSTGVVALTATSNITNIDGNGLNLSKYLPAIPNDPSFSIDGAIKVVQQDCSTISVDKNKMYYEYKSNGDTYVIRTRLESVSNCNQINEDGYPSNFLEMGNYPGLNLTF